MKKLFVLLFFFMLPIATLAATDPTGKTQPERFPNNARQLSVTINDQLNQKQVPVRHEDTPQLLSSSLQKPAIKNKKPLIIFDEWLLASVSLEIANRERQQLEAFGLKIKRRQWLPKLGFVISVYSLPLGMEPEEILKRVLDQYPQLQIEFNQRFLLLNEQESNQQGLVQDPTKQYGYRLTAAPLAGCASFKGGVAMMDGKVDKTLSAFSNRNLTAVDIAAVKGAAVSDHGVAVAYLLTRLLPNASLLALNVYKEGDDGGMETRSDWLLSGFESVLAQQPLPQVLNMSFGGNESRLLQRGIKKLDEKGIRLVAAAGNGGPQAAPVFPAAYSAVVAVSALDADEQLWTGSNQGSYVDYAAPGVDIWVLNAMGKGHYVSGTSFAAPWVTALAAIASAEQWSKPSALARDLGKPGRDSRFGYGLIQFSKLCH